MEAGKKCWCSSRLTNFITDKKCLSLHKLLSLHSSCPPFQSMRISTNVTQTLSVVLLFRYREFNCLISPLALKQLLVWPVSLSIPFHAIQTAPGIRKVRKEKAWIPHESARERERIIFAGVEIIGRKEERSSGTSFFSIFVSSLSSNSLQTLLFSRLRK